MAEEEFTIRTEHWRQRTNTCCSSLYAASGRAISAAAFTAHVERTLLAFAA